MLRGVPENDRLVPIRYVIPNLVTTMALCCGLASLHFTVKGEFEKALAAIAASAVFDALDGRFARMLKVSSRFGAVLDSLSDFVSFGVAPSLLIYHWLKARQDGTLGVWELAAVMIFSLCSALRLARFTSAIPPKVSPQGDGPGDKQDPHRVAQKNFFAGMPTPAAAGAVLIPVMIDASKTFEWRLPKAWVIALTFFIAWLMVSRRPMFSFKRIKIRRGWIVPLLVVVGLLVLLTAHDPWLTIPAMAAAYVISLPLSMFAYHRAVLNAAGGKVRGSWSAGPALSQTLREASQRDALTQSDEPPAKEERASA